MNIFKKMQSAYNQNTHKRTEQDAAELFQVKEYGGELWFTFNGALVLPCAMLKGEAVEVLKQIRELYVKRQEQ